MFALQPCSGYALRIFGSLFISVSDPEGRYRFYLGLDPDTVTVKLAKRRNLDNFKTKLLLF